MIKDYQELRNEVDMLQGNINRMCVTDMIEELNSMCDFAMKRLDAIHNYNYERIMRHPCEDCEHKECFDCPNNNLYEIDSE